MGSIAPQSSGYIIDIIQDQLEPGSPQASQTWSACDNVCVCSCGDWSGQAFLESSIQHVSILDSVAITFRGPATRRHVWCGTLPALVVEVL